MAGSVEAAALDNVLRIGSMAFGGNADTYCTVGTESDDNPVNSYGNTYFRKADLYFYSEEPVNDGAHWWYDENGSPQLWTETD